MTKKLFLVGLAAGFFTFFAPVSYGQIDFANGDVDAILEENALREAFTRYTSMLAFFQPEEATRLGLTTANNRLNTRTPQNQEQALQALESVRTLIDSIDVKNLSAQRKADFHLLKDSVERNIWQLKQNRLTQDPLYYTQALDAVYDLLLQPQGDERKQRVDLLDRVNYLPDVYEQAKTNLTLVSPQLAQLAMEKAYYAHLSFDAIKDRVMNGSLSTNDTRGSLAIENALLKAKNSVYGLFELFKSMSMQQAGPTATLTPAAYADRLKSYYQIDKKPVQLESTLNTQFDKAQHQLFDALRPFELSAEENEVTFVEDLNQRPQEKLSNNTPSKKLPYTPPTANQFYAVADQLVSSFTPEQALEQFSQQVNLQNTFLAKQNALAGAVNMQMQTLPDYFAYQTEFVTYPALSTFWLRVPQGNELAKTQMLNRDFNEPAVKLFISQEVVPGRYYQTLVQPNAMRRMLGSNLLANGWTLYALNAAQEQNIFVTDEELLFVAWQRYVSALSAVVDYRLYTQQYSYEDAKHFLTEQNGFTDEQATALLNDVLRNPGQAVSAVIGGTIWQEAADKYRNKLKDGRDVNALLLEMGNVSPKDVNAELKRLQRNK